MAGLFNSLYKKTVPVNARMALEHFTGTTSPITEKDFTSEELSALRQAIQGTQQMNNKNESLYRDNLQKTKDEYEKKPDTRFVPAPVKGSPNRLVSADIPYEDWLVIQKKSIESYERTRDKTSLDYGSYVRKSGDIGAPVGQGWLDAAYQSYTDPAFRMAATLGSANYYNKNGQTPYVEDTYGFSNNPSFYKDTSTMSTLDIIKKFGSRPASMFELLASRMASQRRPVNISLPPIQEPPNLMYKDPFGLTIK